VVSKVNYSDFSIHSERDIHVQHVVIIGVSGGIDVMQELDLVEGLVEEVLVVFDHLEAH
jgi:hypothetical protein